jgi:tetratricopeptide (TPR) repeat protein
MKHILSTIIFLFGLYIGASACLNEHEEPGPEQPLPRHLTPRDLKAEAPEIREKAAEHLARYKKTKRMVALQAHAVQLILLGRYDEALKALNTVSLGTERWYSLAANRGTLFELRGENDYAYTCIKEAIRINPDAHWGSEWIHLNILKIKCFPSLAINSQNLIGTDFGSGTAPVSKVETAKLKALARQISYQLTERMAFIQPKDSAVACLLFDLANAQVLLGEYDLALENYEWARKYGMEGELLEERIAYLPDAEKNAKQAQELAERAEKEMSALSKKAEEDAAFWERLGGIAFSVVALLAVGITFLVKSLRKRSASSGV